MKENNTINLNRVMNLEMNRVDTTLDQETIRERLKVTEEGQSVTTCRKFGH